MKTEEIKSAHDFAQALPESIKKSACLTCLLTDPKICKGCVFAEYLSLKLKTIVILK
jgi:hypothetical protein